MATINYTVSENVAAGYTLVEWSGMGAGDDGQDLLGKSNAVSATRMNAIRSRTTGGGSVALFFTHL